jgi:CubicO group peptidase (beta-lactamase class C family)
MTRYVSRTASLVLAGCIAILATATAALTPSNSRMQELAYYAGLAWPNPGWQGSPGNKCLEACNLEEAQCMAQAHSSAERQACVRQKERCAADCSAPMKPPLKPVTPPNFSIPEVGYYASWVWPNAGWQLITGSPGDGNSNPASSASGALVKRAGMYSASGMNIVEVWCAPNYYWIYQGYGTQPSRWAFHDASTTKTNGNCFFNVTIGSALRQPIQGVPTPPPPTTAYPRPTSNTPYSFNVTAFANNVKKALNAGNPAPVGFELAVRDPQGKLVYSTASGSATGSSTLPLTPMTTSRRFDTASMSKTITATAVVAALQDLADHKPSLGITLDSSILPYLPSTWNPKASVANVTFRSVLRHTAGFSHLKCKGDLYADVQDMIERGPEIALVGTWDYCDCDYALLRILLPYLVDGPASYKPFESSPTLNAEITAQSYRNYVRCRILDPIGLSGVDEFYTGPLPETIYFDSSRKAVPDNINIPGSPYDETSDHMVLTAGSGNWTLSAEEYSLFISSLWLGKIISPATLTTMLPQHDPKADGVGMGMYASKLEIGGATWWDYNHSGGGGLGGPQGIWMTFFNGYTAVLLSNTAWGLGTTGAFQVMESSFSPALTP